MHESRLAPTTPTTDPEGTREELFFKAGYINGLLFAASTPEPRDWRDEARYLTSLSLGEFLTPDETSDLWQLVDRIADRRAHQL